MVLQTESMILLDSHGFQPTDYQRNIFDSLNGLLRHMPVLCVAILAYQTWAEMSPEFVSYVGNEVTL